jgi:small subunit ribosomal protein S20
MMKTAIRKVQEAQSGDTGSHLRTACSVIDRLVSKGILHRNTAARRKSMLHRFVARKIV